RARRLDRLVPQRVLAGRVAIAAVEDLAAPRDLLDQLALAAAAQFFRAGDAERDRLVGRLDVLALGIRRAAEEAAELGELVGHRRAALLADLVGLLER